MLTPTDYQKLQCGQCLEKKLLGFDFSMAFQPIIDSQSHTVYAHEALVRGVNQEPAGEIFKLVNDTNLYRFDQSCRVKAIELAARLKMSSLLNINFMPNAIYKPELCIRTTLAAADTYKFPVERIVFEFTENERITDVGHIRRIVNYYQQQGFKTAIDDFGAGYAGLTLLAEIRPDYLKIDMQLIRNIHLHAVKQDIVEAIVNLSTKLGITVVAEGIETLEEYRVLQQMGISLFQGYYFSRPQFENLGVIADGLM